MQEIRDRRGGPEPVRQSVRYLNIQANAGLRKHKSNRITRAINDAHKAIGLLR